MTAIHDLFVSDVTRDIPPVVYFHEQSPGKLQDEVSEYIVTGGWPEGHPDHRRVPDGIHEQYVRLLTGIVAELDKKGGPDLPVAWISGFYGSGKSSFAKLLGLALDGVALPSGKALSAAWLARDTSPRKDELKTAWEALRRKVDPIAVVFDIGSVARDNEHIHSAVLRQLQLRLDYCPNDPLVADHELKLERDGRWDAFEAAAARVLGKPWSEARKAYLAGEDFSLVMHELDPVRYQDPMAWYTSRAGTHTRSESPEEAVAAIRDMLARRRPDATLFLVVDEVSQYVLANKDRVDRLRAFATALGGQHGKVWLLALGQQKLEEDADDSFLVWLKDRFPPRLRVHLAATNIRDVVHKRLLHKTPEADARLRALFVRHRADLKLFAYGCDQATEDEFVETYPMLPGHIDLLLQITSALRTRSARAQGDDQAIRGLLQLLGELFRDQRLAELEVGSLVTMDRIYEIQHTALDSDVQASLARILNHCASDAGGWMLRVAKTVAMLELIQDTLPTEARLVAQCLYDRLDRGNQLGVVTEALQALVSANLLGYSAKTGYKIQSSAGEEWEGERRDIGVARELISETVLEALKHLLASPDRPKLQGRPFPWAGLFSDGRRADDVAVASPRDEAQVLVDFRFLAKDERTTSAWVKRSDDTLRDRIVWVCGDENELESRVRDLAKSRAMVRRYKPRRESLNAARLGLLQGEESRSEDLERRVRDDVSAAWMAGALYFRGQTIDPVLHGASFATALESVGTWALPKLFPHFVATTVTPGELAQLLLPQLTGPSPKFLAGELSAGHLGILEQDGGQYVPSCRGLVPSRILEHLVQEKGVGGTSLLARFGGPPYGYTPNVVLACVAGLLRASKVRIEVPGGVEITAIRDPGVADLFEKDRTFRQANLFPAAEDEILPQGRARICKLFLEELSVPLDREDNAIADAVQAQFPLQAQRLRGVLDRLNRLPRRLATPPVLAGLSDALEACLRKVRETRPTVQAVVRHLDALRAGFRALAAIDIELGDGAIASVTSASQLADYQGAQLREIGPVPAELDEALTRLDALLGSERPWQGIAAHEAEVERVRRSYTETRAALLRIQGARAEEARGRIKQRDGFATLTADQSYRVLRPIQEATDDTDARAVAPRLSALHSAFAVRLAEAEELANERLDQILSEGQRPMVTKVKLNLLNREINTEAELDVLVAEIRTRLLEQLRTGARVRLV